MTTSVQYERPETQSSGDIPSHSRVKLISQSSLVSIDIFLGVQRKGNDRAFKMGYALRKTREQAAAPSLHGKMQTFDFTAIETPHGSLTVSPVAATMTDFDLCLNEVLFSGGAKPFLLPSMKADLVFV